MERIVYRKTLDVHKSGIQFTLQGFETADNMARRIEISLMASGDTIDFPLEQITAIMYVTTPNATEPSVNECTIKDNTIIYDVLPIVDEGITEMQVKLIGTRVGGANGVLAAPKFAVEVAKSNTDDESATQTTTYTALENAIATANGVYDSRLVRIELDVDCMFRAYYADGTTYESDVLKELFLKGDALLSQSYARGGTGIRAGEDTDNSMYYSNVSKSASADVNRISGEAKEILGEVRKHGVYTTFSVDFETGEIKYFSPSYTFTINKENGSLEAIGETYDVEATLNALFNEWIENNGIIPISSGGTGASTKEEARVNLGIGEVLCENVIVTGNDCDIASSNIKNYSVISMDLECGDYVTFPIFLMRNGDEYNGTTAIFPENDDAPTYSGFITIVRQDDNYAINIFAWDITGTEINDVSITKIRKIIGIC